MPKRAKFRCPTNSIRTERQRADLEKLEGAEFDLAYMQGQIVDHQKTVQLLIWEIGSGQDAEIQRFAAATLPTVLRHLEMARNLTAELKGGTSTARNHESEK